MKIKNIYLNSNTEVEGCIDVLFQTEDNFIQIIYGEIIFLDLSFNVENYTSFNKDYLLDEEIVEIFQINSLNKSWTTAIELKNKFLIAIISSKSSEMERLEAIEIYRDREEFFTNTFTNSKYYSVWVRPSTSPPNAGLM